MNRTTLLVGIALTLGIPLAATLATIFSAYAQQLSSSLSPSANLPRTTTISAKRKAELCNPSNPSLKVVNTTEARICNIPKTVKNTTTSSSSPLSPFSKQKIYPEHYQDVLIAISTFLTY